METIKHIIKFFFRLAFGFFLLAIVWWLMSILVPGVNFRTLIPSFSKATSTAATGEKKPLNDILPSPRAYTGLLAKKPVQNEYTNVYVPGAPYNGYGGITDKNYSYSTTGYVTYTSTGTSYIGVGQDGLYHESGTVITSAPVTTGGASQGITQGTAQGTVVTPSQTRTQPKPTGSNTSAAFNRNLYVRNLSIYEGGHVYNGLSFIGEARSTFFRQGKFPIVMVDQGGKVIGVSAAVATTDWTIPGWIRFETKIGYVLPNNMPCTMVFEEALLPAERTRVPTRIPLPVRCN